MPAPDQFRNAQIFAIAQRVASENDWKIRPRQLGDALVLAGVYAESTGNPGDLGIRILLTHGMVIPEKHGVYAWADTEVSSLGEKLVGIPTNDGLSRAEIFQLHQMASSYCLMLLAAEDKVGAVRSVSTERGKPVNGALAESLAGMYRDVSRHAVLLELILGV